MIATVSPSRMMRPRRASASSASSATSADLERQGRFGRRDEVIALLGEIQRCLERRDDLEQRCIHLAQTTRQRPFELIERDTRLQRRDGVDQIAHRFRLHEIDADR